MVKRNNIKTVSDRVLVADLRPNDQEESGAEWVPDEAAAGPGQHADEDCVAPVELAADADPGDKSNIESGSSFEAQANQTGLDSAPEEVEAGTGRRFGPRIRRVARTTARTAVVLILVAALGLSAFLGWELKQQYQTADAARTALNVARDYAVILSSIDSKDIDKSFAQVLGGATGDFKNMYSQSSAQLRQLLLDNKAVSHGVVVDAGVKSASSSQVEILLFLDQAVSNSVVPEPRIDRLRMAMTMELVDGRWLASQVEIS